MSLAFEPHYSPQFLAEQWGFSTTTIQRMFENEPGVLRIGEPSRRVGRVLKRSYYTLRIPHSVAERVHQRHLSRGRVTETQRGLSAGDSPADRPNGTTVRRRHKHAQGN
jgi:hypothetical protein